MLTIGSQATRPAAWRYLAELLKEAAAGRLPMTEVEEMLMRALNAEHMEIPRGGAVTLSHLISQTLGLACMLCGGSSAVGYPNRGLRKQLAR
jgi:hypothetical protein